MHWKDIKKCVLHIISELMGKVEKKARKPRIIQGIIDKPD